MRILLISFFIFFVNSLLSNEEIKILKKEILENYNNQNYSTSIQKSIELINVCKKYNNKEELGFAYENIGIFYSDICDYDNSMLYYYKALALLNPKKDKLKYFSIILNLGTTLLEANNNKEAIYFLLKAKKYFENSKVKNISRLICCYTNLAIAFQNINKLNTALEFNDKAIKIAKDNFLLDKYSGPIVNMGDIYLKLNNLELATKYYNNAITYLSNNNDLVGLWHAKMGLADILEKQNKIIEAKKMYLSALSFFLKIKDLKNIVYCYNKLSLFEKKSEMYKEAFQFKENEIIYKDSLKNEENMKAISNVKIQIEIANRNREILLKNEMIFKEKKITRLLFLSVILLLIIIIVLYYNYKSRQKLQKIINLEKEKRSSIEKEILTKKLIHSEKELETFAIHIIQKNEFIENIKDEIKKLKKVNPDEYYSITTNIISKLNHFHKKNNEYNLFLKRVEQANSNFYQILKNKYPNLTFKELKLCALLKLNLSSKEIALLSNVSIGAITMARYRLRSKLDIEKDENLIDFLINLK